MRIFDHLVLNARRYPDAIALVHRERRVSYLELNERVNRLAGNLLQLGVGKGDRVGLMFPNSVEFAETLFAVEKIGAVAVPVNWRYIAREIRWILDTAGCTVFLYDRAYGEQVDPVKKDFAAVRHLVASGSGIPPGEIDYAELVAGGPTAEPDIAVGMHDRAHIQFTGGTSGVPKAVVHTHESAFYTAMAGIIAMGLEGTEEVQLNQVPMFHSAGLNLLVMSVACGGRFVMVETMDPPEILRLIESERVTFMYLLPPYGVGLAILFLGEEFHIYHAAGIALVMAGVIIATFPAKLFGRLKAKPI